MDAAACGPANDGSSDQSIRTTGVQRAGRCTGPTCRMVLSPEDGGFADGSARSILAVMLKCHRWHGSAPNNCWSRQTAATVRLPPPGMNPELFLLNIHEKHAGPLPRLCGVSTASTAPSCCNF